MLGLKKSNKNNLLEVWRSDELGIKVFRLIMSVNRFKFLQQMLHFNDISDPNRPNEKELNKLYYIKERFEVFIENCKKNTTDNFFSNSRRNVTEF